jgi:O-antigen/teichoic acid export membrane protein
MIVRDQPEGTPPEPPSFLRSALLTYGTNLAAAFLSLLNAIVVARALGAEGRGNVAFLTAMAWLTANLAMLGIQEANANIAAREPAARRSLATNSLLLSLLLGLCSIGALAVLIWLFPGVAGDSDQALRWLTFAFVPLIILQGLFRFLIQADYGFAVTNAAYLLGPITNVVLNGLFAMLGILSVGTAIGVWLFGQTLDVAVLTWYVRRSSGFGRLDVTLGRRMVGFGAKAHAGRILMLGNYRLDQWLLGAIAGPRELGLYSAAVAWAEALWHLPTALAAVQRPSIVRAAPRAAAQLATRVFRGAAVVTGALVIVMIVAAPVLCVVFFGEGFRGSIDDLRVLAIGAFGMVALKVFGNALVAQRRPVLQSTAVGVGFAITVGLDVILIPPYGGVGAALASTIAYTAAGAVVCAIFLRALGGGASELLPRGRDLAWLVRQTRGRLAGAPSQAP